MQTTEKRLTAVNGMWAGLGNRLRFTLSAQRVAAAESRCFSYIWPTAPGVFESKLTDLWEFPFPEVETNLIPNLTERPSRLGRPAILTSLRRVHNWDILGTSVLRLDGFEENWEHALPDLTLNPSLSSRVAEIRRRLPARYIGVQVRADSRSHPETLKNSPPEWFALKMREWAMRDASTHFYLSCDEPEAQRHLEKMVPNVISIHKRGAYNSKQGLEEAVTDLYLLAESSHLLGPHLSSFVELAWMIGGRSQPLETSLLTLPAKSGSPSSQLPPPSLLYLRPPIVSWGRNLIGGISAQARPNNRVSP